MRGLNGINLRLNCLELRVLYACLMLQIYGTVLLVDAAYPPANSYQDRDMSYHRQQQQQPYQQLQQQQEQSQATDAYTPLSDQYALPQYVNNADGYRKHERNVPQNPHRQQQQQHKNNQNHYNYQQVQHTEQYQQKSHKCQIWIPVEAFDKYPLATKVQDNESKHERLIEICCPGYSPMLWRGSIICRPVCKNCQNGLCIAPEQCKCYDEFVRNDNGDCVFTCPLGCLNGHCYLDGTCQCNPGYKLDETRKFCRPICTGGCGTNPRHNCTEPEVCACAKGYQLTDMGCEPVCQPECGIGGHCREKNVCECETPYNLKNNVCQTQCYQKCENGSCYSRNRCICNPGYTYHERSTTCIPI